LVVHDLFYHEWFRLQQDNNSVTQFHFNILLSYGVKRVGVEGVPGDKESNFTNFSVLTIFPVHSYHFNSNDKFPTSKIVETMGENLVQNRRCPTLT
jgi:hypothetical protein